ncbi:MAG: hypothetical protein B5M56_00445 [Desulfococcus sp. 4484_241]|nr:MAG: hypothetical protein B5M56_00445 [Desulfococcus sp. 4484_241]
MRKRSRSGVLPGISSFVIIGVVLVIIPIFVFIVVDNIKTHDKRVVESFKERGVALIRSFEAGTRTGMIVMMWNAEKVQRLLIETALQEDIDYILITDDRGRILAHSDPRKIGRLYAPFPSLPQKNDPSTAYWRILKGPDGTQVFEVYKQFTPNRYPALRGRLKQMLGRLPPDRRRRLLDDWFGIHFFPQGGAKPVRQFIFVGFDMGKVNAARGAYIRHMAVIGIILLLIGCVGMVALFSIQAYRSARSSFARVKAFSDEVVANMPAGLITIGPDRSVTSCNRKASEILGYEYPSAGDEPATVLSLPPVVRSVADKVMDTAGNVSEEVEYTGVDGTRMSLDISGSVIRDASGRISGYLLLLKDLTGIRKLEREVARSKRFATIGKLAAGVAHEIRNPLSSIKGFATYFKEKFKDSEEERKTAQTMIYEVERLNRAVTQLLEFSRPVSVELADVPVSELIEHSLRLVENDFKRKGIDYSVNIRSCRDKISTDRDRLNQILLNLYLNAVEAMDEGGRLAVTVLDGDDGKTVVIEVSDTGHGIREEHLDHIFDPYFTTRSTGTGLGLAIVYKLVETLGGKITVESAVGRGTVFRIYIPA